MGEQRRVLIVDSDPTFGRALAAEFSSQAFDVDAVSTPDDAIARVAARSPDLVILDLYLPAGAALVLLRRWKAEVPGLTVILVSGNASLNLVVDALKEGARRFFTKPVSARELLAEFEERRLVQHPYLSPLVARDHQLGTAALTAEGVDRFFAISPGLLSVTGFDGYFKLLNPAWERALGYTIDELCAAPYLELVHPDDRDKATDEALEIRGGETVFRFKNRYRCKDGTYRWLAWSATPSPIHRLIYASARDVTRSVRLEQGLRAANAQLTRDVATRERRLAESDAKHDTLVELSRFREEVTAMIVHDLKNPLSVIISNYEYLLEAFDGPADCLEALEDSQIAARRMLRLLVNLVDVERLEVGTLDVRAAPVDLVALLNSVAAQRRALARARHVAIGMPPHASLTVNVDPDLVTRAIENVFDNALRHTPIGGVVEVALDERGDDVEIQIGNSGPAIPLASRDAIFEKYGQATPEVGHMNLGLGLYFCRLAINAQGGAISVDETARLPTVFKIRLPREVRVPSGAA